MIVTLGGTARAARRTMSLEMSTWRASAARNGPPPGASLAVADVYARLMRVEVNSELCQGHNRCYALAPELFDVDDYGSAVVIGDGTVDDALHDKARLAAANCPEYAITVID